MTDVIMSREQRLASEAAELAAAEQQYAQASGTAQQEPAPQQQAQGAQPQQSKAQPDGQDVNWEKRYKDLQSHADKHRAETEKQLQALKSQLEAAGIAPGDVDEVAQMKEQLRQLEEFKQTAETQAAVRRAQEAVSQVHPDFEEVITDPIFEEWISKQPDVFKDAIYNDIPDAALASKALTLFKAETGLVGESLVKTNLQKEQAQAAQSVKVGTREAPQANTEKVWSFAEIQRMSPSEYAKHADAIDKAYAEGRIR